MTELEELAVNIGNISEARGAVRDARILLEHGAHSYLKNRSEHLQPTQENNIRGAIAILSIVSKKLQSDESYFRWVANKMRAGEWRGNDGQENQGNNNETRSLEDTR